MLWISPLSLMQIGSKGKYWGKQWPPEDLQMEVSTTRRRGPNDVGVRPLHGIPILIKNNIATNDKMNNTGKLHPSQPRRFTP